MGEEETKHTWIDRFYWSDSNYYGCVRSIEEATELIEDFSNCTSTYYVEIRCSKNFGNYNIFERSEASRQHFIRFEDKNMKCSRIPLQGVPFMIVGNMLMECHQGPNRRMSKKSETLKNDNFKEKRGKVTSTKKVGCEAAIYLREIVLFPEYKIPRDTHYCKQDVSSQLRNDFQSTCYEDIKVEKRIFIDLPKPDSHIGHIMGDAAALKAPIDDNVLKHARKLVADGVHSVAEMKRHINIFVKEMFGKDHLPKSINRKYYPSRMDLRKIISRERKRLMKGLLDQERLEENVKRWEEEGGHHVFLRLSKAVQKSVLEKEFPELIAKSTSQSFLFVYQSDWQQQMLRRYGSDIVFLDATYKTTKYALPLYFLCVHTNCGYFVAATFIMESEDKASLIEALMKVQEMNPGFSTRNFMIDSSEVEMNAVRQSFPAADIYISDFHRKNAMLRWLKTAKNGCSEYQEKILNLLNLVAESVTVEEYVRNVKHLKESWYWTNNKQLRDYIEKHWLNDKKYKSWIWAFRGTDNWMTLIINTNNGVEVQNKVFKYEYLAPYKEKTVSGLMKCLLEFFQDKHREYLEYNVNMSSGWRKSADHVPKELQHRPPFLLKHMKETEKKAIAIQEHEVRKVNEWCFEVDSGPITYTLTVGNVETLPSCLCRQFQKTRMPCEHFLSVFRHTDASFESFPNEYKNNPVFTIDKDCLGVDLFNTKDCSTDEGCDINQPSSSNLMKESNTETNHQQTTTTKTCKQLRDISRKINSLSYLIQDNDVLETARVEMERVLSFLCVNCPKDTGLPLVCEEQERSSVKRKLPTELNELPKPTKKKSYSSKSYDSQTTAHA